MLFFKCVESAFICLFWALYFVLPVWGPPNCVHWSVMCDWQSVAAWKSPLPDNKRAGPICHALSLIWHIGSVAACCFAIFVEIGFQSKVSCTAKRHSPLLLSGVKPLCINLWSQRTWKEDIYKMLSISAIVQTFLPQVLAIIGFSVHDLQVLMSHEPTTAPVDK